VKTNLFILTIILSLPFALSSQTRKAIPAGRYEALSGVKVSHGSKNQETNNHDHDSSKQIWDEVEKYFINEPGEVYYANLAGTEVGIKSRNFHEAKSIDQGLDLLITSDLKKDKEFVKHLKGKKMVALFDSRPLEKIITTLHSYEVVSYRAEGNGNFYLLKTK
jgi:hypothetical protein